MVVLYGLAMCTFSGLLLRRFAGRWLRSAEPQEDQVPGPWSTRHLLMVVLFGVVLQTMAGILLAMFARSRGVEIADLSAGIMLLTAAFWQGALVLLLVFVAREHPQGLASLGLMRTRPRAVLVGLGTYLLALPALFGSILLWSQTMEWIGRGGETQAVQELILRTRGAEVILAVVLAVGVIPFLEEVIFRGWLQGWISNRLSPAHGIVISAALFALMHGAAVLLPIFVLALLLGVVRHKTGRMGPVWAMHALHNGIQMFFLLYVLQDQAAASPLSLLP